MPSQLVLDPRDVSAVRGTVRSPPHEIPKELREFGYIPDFQTWCPGDLLLFCNCEPTYMQRGIQRTQSNLNYADEDSRWHHAAVYIGDLYLCEARPGRVRYHRVLDSINPHTLVRIRRDENLEDAERFRVAIRALMRLSMRYAYLSATRVLIRSLRRKRDMIGLLARQKAQLCSQLFHDAYAEVTESILVQRVDREILPADLSATEKLVDVAIRWVRLPSI